MNEASLGWAAEQANASVECRENGLEHGQPVPSLQIGTEWCEVYSWLHRTRDQKESMTMAYLFEGVSLPWERKGLIGPVGQAC